MSSTPAPPAVTFHIPPDLQHLRVPFERFLKDRPFVDRLVVGAFVFVHGEPPPSTSAASVSAQKDTYRALYDFAAENKNECALKEGQLVEVIQRDDRGWWHVKAFDRHDQGWSPSAYLTQESLNFSAPSSTPETRLLLLQRSSRDSFPDRWEVPGGSSDRLDPTILHSVARELFEETGLRLNRFVRQVGDGIVFETGPESKKKRCLKLSFEVEVSEIPSTFHEGNGRIAGRVLDSLSITLHPAEHQEFAWATEEDIKNSDPNRALRDRRPYEIFTEDQRLLMLQAFELHMAGQYSR